MAVIGNQITANNDAIKGYYLKGSDAPEIIIGVPAMPANFLTLPPMNSIVDFIPADVPNAYSPLGTPIYSRIILGDHSGTNDYTDAQGNKGTYKTVVLDCALCTVDFNSQVVKTNIQGLPQTIKEFISSGDNDVTITGLYNSTPGVAPVEFKQNLNNMFKAPIPIPVTNDYLNELDIYYIVIMPGTQMGQTEGGYATQTFTIRAITDTPMTQMLP